MKQSNAFTPSASSSAVISGSGHAHAKQAELFRRHHQGLLRQVRREVNTAHATVEDAVGFAFLQLCQTPPERDDSIGGWLHVVARREAIRDDHRQRRAVSLDAPAHGQDEQTGEPLTLANLLAAPVDTELAVEAREALRALADLRWRRRRVLALKVAGFSYREIQERLGVTYTNVNRQLTRARKDLEHAGQPARVSSLEAPS